MPSDMAGQRNSCGKRSYSQSHNDDGGRKKRNPGDDREQFVVNCDDTVYRYLCPARKIESVIGKEGDLVKQLRIDTKSKIWIGEAVPGCEERVITICSTSKKTNSSEGAGHYVCPAQDALFRIHERIIVAEMADKDSSKASHFTARLLILCDQTGSVIGKSGETVEGIRNGTGAQIRILRGGDLPSCASRSDELILIFGYAEAVKKALFQISSLLHDNPSRSQQLLASTLPNVSPSDTSLLTPAGGAPSPTIGITPLISPYGRYKGVAGDQSCCLYSAQGMKEFSLRLVCPVANIGGVISEAGLVINQISKESAAAIKIDISTTMADDCLINISAQECPVIEDAFSPVIEAAVRLQPRCSETLERDSGLISFTTRMLVPISIIGCLIGKGGAIISELRRLTKADIRFLSKENLPKIVPDDEEIVQLSGVLKIARDALVQVTTRLRANVFDRDGAITAALP